MSAPTRDGARPSREEGSMDSFDDWDILSPPSAPHSDDERDTVVVQHGAKDNNNMECVEPRRASSVAAPGTPTGFSAGSFARADSNSDVDVADEFEDLDAGVISRFPPRHSSSSYSDAQQRLRNDMAEPAGVDQWLRLAEESLTAGASRAASDLVAPARPSSNAAPAQSPTSPSKTLGPARARAGRISRRAAKMRIFLRGKFRAPSTTTTGARWSGPWAPPGSSSRWASSP